MNRFRDLARTARSGVEELLSRLATGAESLSAIDPEALSSELKARKSAGARQPRENKMAELAGGGEALRARRASQAAERRERVTAERERQARVEKKAQQEAFRSAQARARESATASSESYGARDRSRSRPRAPSRRDGALAKHYQTLHLPVGADFAEVKAAYRKLMRRYHPDLHNQSPSKQKAATELSVQVTQAYNELEKHLKG